MYPHERSLVKHMEGKPFALLGINSDPKDALRKAMKQENITWRSWWDGGSTVGPMRHSPRPSWMCPKIASFGPTSSMRRNSDGEPQCRTAPRPSGTPSP